ncbi:MAG: hypothetical protein MJ233_00220 [Mycoplasmoidaceae bacterium]|nr:hypothetical protein [Mycoplasmoidaceae bacterium]
MNVIRNLQTIYKLLINDLYFVNATPTTEDVFLTHEDGENHIILDG